MKTEIFISGQISGNFTLRNAIITADCTERMVFNNIVLTFKTKKLAIKALSQGYQYLSRRYPELKNQYSGIKYARAHALAYDASRAKISQ